MKLPARRLAVFVLVGLFIAMFATGCTLAGADAAPLTPVTSGGGEVDGQPADGGQPVDSGAGETVPTPTEMAPIDFFGTQTAEAPPPEEPTEEPTQEPGDDGSGGGGEVVEATEEPTQEPEATAEPVETQEPAGESSSASCPPTHTVQPGENLFRIALKYNLTTQQLASANGITNADQLQVGTVLNIPGCSGSSAGTGSTGSGTTHTVQPGENLFRIALQYNLTTQELAQYNGIVNPDDITVGQVLRIP